MAKIAGPVLFSTQFNIKEDALKAAGVLNPTLNVDTKLFIDALLVPHSKHPEISKKGRKVYTDRFCQVIRLLKASKYKGDVAWKGARRLMAFPEIKWTCLGYGANSTSGSGSGAFTTDGVMKTAKEIVDLGVDDPDLFVALGLFEEGIGPDRISDMTANVILPGLLDFNKRVLAELGVPTRPTTLTLPDGNSYPANLPANPYQKRGQSIILVPSDILRAFPIANDWSDVCDAASRNAALRHQINIDIGGIWRRKTLKDKAELRQRVMADQNSFETLLKMLREADAKPYDLEGDALGELVWRRIAHTIAAEQPFTLKAPSKLDVNGVAAVVEEIIKQFCFLIQDRRISEELYHEDNPRPEKSAQRLFFAVAYAYCKANNLDITPEADTGNGPVDFKVSNGFTGRVLVEIKLSTNGKVVAGYSRQLETYKGAEETTKGFYVLIDVGQMGKKYKSLLALKNREAAAGRVVSPIILIDGKRRPSASKLT